MVSLINGLFSDETGLWIGLNDMNHYRRYTWQASVPLFITNTLSYSDSDQPDKRSVLFKEETETGLWIGLKTDVTHGRIVPHFSLQILYLTVTVVSLIKGLFSNETGLWIGLNDMNHNSRYTWQDSDPLFITKSLSCSESDQPDEWSVL